MPRSSGGIAAVAVLVVASACSGDKSVSGVVTLDGQPLPRTHLVFFPKQGDPRTAQVFVADTDEQGRFTVGAIGSPRGGIPAGPYRLALTTAYAATAGDDEPPPPERVPESYRGGVDFEVPSGGIRDAVIELKSK